MTPIIHPDDRERQFAMLDALEAGRDSYEAEIRLVRPDGGIVWVREQGDVERDAQGARTNVSGTLQDISPYRLLEEQLIQSQKMEALGQLTGGIAHDFNNLLAVILGNLDLLSDNAGLMQPAKRHIDLARRAAARGAEMTRRLLIFARRQPLAPRVTTSMTSFATWMNCCAGRLGAPSMCVWIWRRISGRRKSTRGRWR